MKRFFKTMIVSVVMMACAATLAFAGQWKRDARGWWYQNDNGTYPKSEWRYINGAWYCFDGAGYMLHDTWSGDYYLGADGAMLTNTTTPDGYRVGADGKWIPGGSQSTSTTVYNYFVTHDSSVTGYFQTNDPQSGLKHLTIEGNGSEIFIKETGEKYTLRKQDGAVKCYQTPYMVGGDVEYNYIWIDESQGICEYSNDPYDIRLDYFIISTRSPSEYITTTDDVMLKTGRSVSREEAKRIAENHWGIVSGQRDRETGYEMWADDPDYVINPLTNRGYYMVTLHWFVSEGGRGHASTLGTVYIEPETGKVYEKLTGLTGY